MPLVNPDGLPNLIPGNLEYVESNGKNLSDVGQSIVDTGAAGAGPSGGCRACTSRPRRSS